MRAVRTLVLVAGAAAAVLLPLYGDPSPAAAVSHPEWARLLLRGLDLLTDTPGVNDTAAQAFATLSGRDSRAFPAEGFVRASHVELVGAGAARRLQPVGGIGEAVYAIGVARPGDYRLRLHLSGPAPAETEMTKAGDNAVFRRLTVPAAPVMGWSDAGVVHLDPGAYDATVLLPEGSALEYVELAPPCVHPIEPPGGWKATAVATTEDVGVTTLQALDLESELPPSGAPLELRGSDLRFDDGSPVATTGAGSFRGGARGARVLLLAQLPEAGLYTVSVFGVRASGQRWITDGCRSCVVCPSSDPTPRWQTILSGRFQKGQHIFTALLGPETIIERIRLEPKKAAPADYVATLERLGLSLGPAGPISRENAEEARRFLSRRRAQLTAELCGDILRPGTLVAELAASGPTSSSAGGGEAGGGAGGGGGETGGGGSGATPSGGGGSGPVPPPVIPPLPPPSPTLPVGFEGN